MSFFFQVAWYRIALIFLYFEAFVDRVPTSRLLSSASIVTRVCIYGWQWRGVMGGLAYFVVLCCFCGAFHFPFLLFFVTETALRRTSLFFCKSSASEATVFNATLLKPFTLASASNYQVADVRSILWHLNVELSLSGVHYFPLSFISVLMFSFLFTTCGLSRLFFLGTDLHL